MSRERSIRHRILGHRDRSAVKFVLFVRCVLLARLRQRGSFVCVAVLCFRSDASDGTDTITDTSDLVVAVRELVGLFHWLLSVPATMKGMPRIREYSWVALTAILPCGCHESEVSVTASLGVVIAPP